MTAASVAGAVSLSGCLPGIGGGFNINGSDKPLSSICALPEGVDVNELAESPAAPGSSKILPDNASIYSSLTESPGWNHLSERKQNALERILSSDTALARSVTFSVEEALDAPKFQKRSADAQAEAIWSAVKSGSYSSVKWYVNPSLDEPAPYSILTPEQAAEFQKTKPAPAPPGAASEVKEAESKSNTYFVQVDGRSIPVKVPKSIDIGATDGYGPMPKAAGGRQLPTIDRIAITLARMPREQRNLICNINLSETPNRYDKFMRIIYGKDFSGAAAGMWHGTMILFPLPESMESELALLLLYMHEGGHPWAQHRYGDLILKQIPSFIGDWGEWREAMKADALSASHYATESLAEDAAETTMLYFATRGTEDHEKYRILFRNRFAILDRTFPPPAPSNESPITSFDVFGVS
jgi:hypothetical protein